MYEAPAPVKVEGGGRAGQRRWLSHWGTRALGGSASPAGAQNEGSLPKCPTRVQDGQTFTPLSLSVTGCQLSPKEVAPGRWVSAAQAHPEGDGALQLTTFLQPVSRKRMWAVPPCPPQAFHLRDPALPSPRARGDPAETAGPVVKSPAQGHTAQVLPQVFLAAGLEFITSTTPPPLRLKSGISKVKLQGPARPCAEEQAPCSV